MTQPSYDFPLYSKSEILADIVVHLVSILVALGAVIWLISSLPPGAGAKLTMSVWIYSISLLCMLTASALYNATRAGALKAKLRRLDHAMIFMMIAGSYTPFALNALPLWAGILLFVIIWALASAGIMFKFLTVTKSNLVSTGLYIGMGWLMVVFLPALISSVGTLPLLLLLAGGIIYSLGAFIHSWASLRYNNVIWHVMVALAASLHFCAILQVV
jgi:hemolysin III